MSRFVGIAVDVTDLVELTEAQRRSDERFRNLIAKAPLGQTVCRPRRAACIEVNPAWAGHGRAHPTRSSLGTDAIHWSTRTIGTGPTTLARQLLAGEVESVEQERRLVRPDGSLGLGVEHHHPRARRRRTIR